MPSRRPSQSIRLNYWKSDPEYAANFTIYGTPAEARMSASETNFISVRQDGISISPGVGNNVNFQGMSQNMKYGGMLNDLPFPLSVLPTTPFTPFPNQVFSPPLKEILPLVKQLTIISTSFVGI